MKKGVTREMLKELKCASNTQPRKQYCVLHFLCLFFVLVMFSVLFSFPDPLLQSHQPSSSVSIPHPAFFIFWSTYHLAVGCILTCLLIVFLPIWNISSGRAKTFQFANFSCHPACDKCLDNDCW